ncbi:MAG: DUF4160 domain-containing protein [Chloroflexi bacterium]|nr:DUF4160 domain-containing protein [Chloroflexota bacterium]
MPRLSEFYGIVIGMFYEDHPPPHFHAVYGGQRALIGIDPIAVLQGYLPRRALSLVLEWAALHQRELLTNWERARRHEPLVPIEPLD